jgi:hypothetical protein
MLTEFFDSFEILEAEECWLWHGRSGPGGYGWLRSLRAHRVSWELFLGPIPFGQHVLHRCDSPPCVNPGHLFLGTHEENMADKIAKGRHRSIPICSIPGCGFKVLAKGLCSAHYWREKRNSPAALHAGRLTSGARTEALTVYIRKEIFRALAKRSKTEGISLSRCADEILTRDLSA